MTLFWLTISTLFAGFGLGYVKFFLLSILSNHDVSHKNWLIQVVGAIITLGPFLVFYAASPLASSIRKRFILSATCITTFIMLAFGASTGWIGTAWWYLFASGLIMGFYLPAKNAAVPLEAKHDHRSTESVNATLNIAYLVGLLSGIPAATLLYEINYTAGIIVLLLAFLGAGLSGYLCRFPEEEPHLIPFRKAVESCDKATRELWAHHKLPILVSGLIWGLANAISLAITAYAETQALGTPFECSLMSVYAIVGVAIGNVYAIYLSEVRKTAVVAGLATLFLTTAFVPPFCFVSLSLLGTDITYWMLALLVICLGVGFGISTNLIEGEFYRRVYDEGMEGGGGAILSASTAFFSCALGLIVGTALHLQVLGPQSQFICLALVVVVPLLLFLKSQDSEGWWHRLVARALRMLLTLRYKITFKGFENIPTEGPVLILPNHPAEIDPVIVGSHLWKRRTVRPLMLEEFYELPLVHSIMSSIRAIPMPDMEYNAGPFKLRRVEQALASVVEGLQNEDAILMYPSGRLQRNGKELLGAASGLRTILNENPEIPVVLIRSKGLYGSNFSCAFSGNVSPDFFGSVKTSIEILLKNLIFFAPKRKVLVEIERADATFPRSAETRELNSWLENWYNAPGFDECLLVPERFWSSQVKEPVQIGTLEPGQLDEVPEDVQKKVQDYLCELADKDSCEPNDSLRDDLGLDSLVLTEILIWLEDEFDAFDVKITDISTVASVMKIAAEGQPLSDNTSTSAHAKGWENASLMNLAYPAKESIGACFVEMAKSRAKQPGMADPMAGVLSWGKVLRNSLLLASKFREFQEDKIGVLLPASCSASITTMALLLAGKTPVLINWTTGARTVHQILEGAEVKTIITARKFLDQLQANLIELEDLFFLLEDLKSELGISDIIKSYVQSYTTTPAAIEAKADDTAIVLFTSGSESLPKGVPLTHRNIISNVQGALELIPIDEKDSILGFLPPFHSFGLTASVFLPMVTGLRTAYHPNPTEARKLVRAIARWQASIIAGTPTFLRQILLAGEQSSFSSLRILLSGAEKAPEKLFTLAEKKAENAQILEGYGITECSPIVSVNSPDDEARGVGKPLPELDIKIVDPETHKELEQGENGLILVRGPSVFSGYLDAKKNSFITLDGEKWYNTGDLGAIKNEGIHLSGRLKRFIKVAGEMISLQALEESLYQLPDTQEQNEQNTAEQRQLAVVAIEPEDGSRPIIGLYTNSEISLEAANSHLKEQGFANIAKISRVIKKDELPMLGSGKVNIRALNEDFKSQVL